MSKMGKFFRKPICRSSKPKFEMLVRLNATLFTFPKNNITKNNLPCRNASKSGNF